MPRRAYTLAEVIMARALLLLVLTFVAGLFLHLFVASSKSLDSSLALEMADSVLNQATDSDPGSWAAMAETQSIYNRDPRTTTEFHTVMSFPSTPTIEHDMGQIYEVSVEVYWMDRPDQTRHQYGRQSVKLSKEIYVSICGSRRHEKQAWLQCGRIDGIHFLPGPDFRRSFCYI